METVSETKDIGAVLRQAREMQSVSLEDVSALLKIREDHLQALENNDFDRLPGHVYAIGFIRTYATHLGLNAGELISLFKEATMSLPVEEASYNEASNEPISLGLKLGLGVFAVFLVYLMWLIAGGAGTSDRQAAVKPPETVEKQSLPVEVEASEKVVTPVATPPERPEVAASVAPSAGPIVISSPAEADEGADNGEPVQGVGSSEVVEVAALEAPQEDAIADNEPAAPQKVEIRASRRTWMRIENTEGTVLFSSIIRDGESFALEEDTPYTLATRDAGALHFHVDEEKVGDVGRRGQILTARQIDRAGIIALIP